MAKSVGGKKRNLIHVKLNNGDLADLLEIAFQNHEGNKSAAARKLLRDAIEAVRKRKH